MSQPLIKGYSDFSVEASQIIHDPDQAPWKASCGLDGDVSAVFPYINSVLKDAIYYDKPHHIQFGLQGHWCTLHPNSLAAFFFTDREQAVKFIRQAIDFLNDLYGRKDSIRPNHHKFQSISALDVYRILPQTNCGECGFQTCLAFAAALSRGKAVPEWCPGMEDLIYENAVFPIYDKDGQLASTIAININAPNTHLKRGRRTESTKTSTAAASKNTVLERASEEEINPGLTGREMEVLKLVTQGCTNMEISSTLSISPHTVKSHVTNIFNKLNVSDRTQAAVWATRYKLI